MTIDVRNLVNLSTRSIPALAFSVALGLGISTSAGADEADAKRLLKGMSDYLAAQQALSFSYDATLEVVTQEDQILGVASSGTVALRRPDKIRATRAGGFADVDMSFDGTTLTILGKNINKYTQIEVPGSISHLVDVLRDEYGRPLPAADLLLSNAYDVLMQDVVDIKDLGSGVIGGVECDSLAFRTKDVDWQIWIARGEKPYPCRYVITSKQIASAPSYTVQIRDWKTGKAVAASDFKFKNSSKAAKVTLEDLKGAGDLPDHFVIGESK
ncbi:DUF2092 domain-containing protein [Accumulibacter sp.]|uniref:DUF2092 domain-containing protein n=1 Tax=Accumulibacter sp. TaxID=2053492 RepID=UPI0028C3A440|nr:DUF2092 domain-containing protein [Accumulibacter sp.]